MTDSSRRSVLKTACFCGISACAAGTGGCSQVVAGTGAESTPKRDPMPYKWIAAMLPLIDANTKGDQARTIIKGCAQSHFDHLEMSKTMARFTGRLESFLEFLHNEWGWIIEHDKENGVVLIDENKSVCVCPLVQKDIAVKSGSLCYCSEGFAERMFSSVIGHAVRAEVRESILRGDKSCKYRIVLMPPQPNRSGAA
jgi:predicted hydrocarbon binding protein